MKNTIEKQIELNAPLTKVWSALTDHNKFGEWFGVKLDGPFVAGKSTKGQMTIPGYEHKSFEAAVKKLEPENFFSYTWHPCGDGDYDCSADPQTLVEFTFKEQGGKTLLTVVESGFDKLPANRQEISFRGNSEGWNMQLENIKNYVSKK